MADSREKRKPYPIEVRLLFKEQRIFFIYANLHEHRVHLHGIETMLWAIKNEVEYYTILWSISFHECISCGVILGCVPKLTPL